MTIAELKRALVEVREFCESRSTEEIPCDNCPFDTKFYGCKLHSPDSWRIDDWKEDAQDATQGTDQAE